MLSQRLAKQALLQYVMNRGIEGDTDPSHTRSAFESALDELKKAPLCTTAIREDLAAADEELAQMLQGMQAIATRAGRARLMLGSEALLDRFDRLTDRYEHCMQSLLG
jgi:hypothetical protein